MKQHAILLTAFLLIGSVFYLACKKEYSCEGCSDGNARPVAIAGKDRIITLPKDTIVLDGSASYDTDGEIRKWFWTKLSGPPSTTFSPTNTSKTILSKLVSGAYRFELKVEDNGFLAARDTVDIIIKEAFQPNRPPIANAGTEQLVIFPVTTIMLDGSRSTDPDNNIVQYAWTKILGPSSFSVVNSAEKKTSVINMVDGVYFFELKVTDAEGLFSKDTVKITFIASDNTVCDNSVRPQIVAQMSSLANLSKPRTGVTVASCENKIVFAGGRSNTSSEENGCSRVDIFDIGSQTWSTAELSVPRYAMAAVTVGSKIFFAGGERGDGYHNVQSLYNTVDIYDASTNSWSVIYLSQARSFISAVVVGNKVFFAGGRIGDNVVSDRIDIYDVATNQWSTGALSEGRSRMSGVTANNKVYFAGGCTKDGWYAKYSNRIDIYDNATNIWSVSYLTQPMGLIGGTVLGNKIYWTNACRVEIWDVNSETSTIAYLSHPGYWSIDNGQNAVVKDNKIIFHRPFGEDTNKFDIYDPQTNTWKIGVYPPIFLEYSSIISVNNEIYVAGGSIFGGIINRVSKLVF